MSSCVSQYTHIQAVKFPLGIFKIALVTVLPYITLKLLCSEAEIRGNGLEREARKKCNTKETSKIHKDLCYKQVTVINIIYYIIALSVSMHVS